VANKRRLTDEQIANKSTIGLEKAQQIADEIDVVLSENKVSIADVFFVFDVMKKVLRKIVEEENAKL